MTTIRMKVAFLLIAVSLPGCRLGQPRREFEPITLDTADASGTLDYSGLAAVLKAAASTGGEISPEKLNDNDKMLEGQLMLMALSGPKTQPHLFKSDHAILNYWYNARAAWSLRLMLTFSRDRLKASGETTSATDRWRFTKDGVSVEKFNNRPFPIDGRSMTLGLMDSLIEEEFGFKAVVAAPGVAPLRAAIPTQPFNTQSPSELIDKRFNEFVDDEKRFAIDPPTRQILTPPVLWRFGKRIIAAHHRKYGTTGASLTTALLPHVRFSPHRRLQDAIGYEPVEAPDKKVPLIVKRDED